MRQKLLSPYERLGAGAREMWPNHAVNTDLQTASLRYAVCKPVTLNRWGSRRDRLEDASISADYDNVAGEVTR